MGRRFQLVISLLMIVSFITVLMPSKGYACSCAYEPSVEEELEKSKVVFSGDVVSIREVKPFGVFQNLISFFTDLDHKYYPEKHVIFNVSSTWKGASQSQLIIETGLGGGDCGYEFQVGQSYLVYAGGNDGHHTSICHRTTELVSAKEDLSVLGQGQPPTEQVNLQKKSESIIYFWVLAFALVIVVVFLVRRFVVKRS
jgi:hypothetical protein